MKLNINEKKVLDLLRENPYSTQKEISEKLDVSRPTVANIISGLQEKGYIIGKPYVLRKENYITCVGGMNFDVSLKLDHMLMAGTSNPVVSNKSFGGVVRNVAENLARLGLSISLMSLLGDDIFGQELLKGSNEFMETFAIDVVPNESTGTYYSVIDPKGDMAYGFANMHINRMMDASWIIRHKKHLIGSEYIICDLNVSKSGVEALLEFKKDANIPMAIIGVSGPKMVNLPKDIKDLDLIICNKDETQAYFKTTIDDGVVLCKLWLDRGVKRVVVTNGVKGSYYGDQTGIFHQKAYLVDQIKIVDVTGAGDAFSAALLYGLIRNESLEKSVQLGAMNSSLTIQVPFAVNPNVSIKRIEKEIKNYENQ